MRKPNLGRIALSRSTLGFLCASESLWLMSVLRCSSPDASATNEPCSRARVIREEGEQLLGRLLTAARAGMYAVANDIVAVPNQAVALARHYTVGPKIGPP